jgi:hypothetical protein
VWGSNSEGAVAGLTLLPPWGDGDSGPRHDPALNCALCGELGVHSPNDLAYAQCMTSTPAATR